MTMLKEVKIELTNRCARNCKHCSSSATNSSNNIKELDFEDEIEYYKKASKYKVNNMENIKKIIKLSTCSYLNNHTTPTNQRYYIIAMLEKVE